MPLLAILFGLLLDILGLVSYFTSHGASVTALIPSFFGTALVTVGVLALAFPKARKHFMHLAATVGLVGALGGLGMGLPKLGTLLEGTAARPQAVIAQLVLGALCLIFVALCVRSFILARKAQAKS